MLLADVRRARPPAAMLAVCADDIRPLRRAACDAGVSFAEILSGIDLPAGVLDDPAPASISLADYFRILERLSLATHDESWGLSARRLLPGATGLVLSNLASCATLGQAMKAIAHAYNLLHGGSYNRVEVRADALAYVIDDRDFPYSRHADRAHVCFTMECVLIFLHGLLTLISGDALHGMLRAVHTKRPRAGVQCSYLDFWPAPVRLRARQFALCYEPAAAALALSHDGAAPSATMIYRKVIELIEHKQDGRPRRRSTLEQVSQAFGENVYAQEAVARRLRLSVATLRRRLDLEGQPSFRALREQAMNRAACSLLAGRRHPREVAELLGFGELRSFARAFKRWNGRTPAAYAQARSVPQTPR